MYEEYSGIQLTWEMGQLQCVSFLRRFETTVSEVNHKLPFFSDCYGDSDLQYQDFKITSYFYDFCGGDNMSRR